MKNFSPEVFDKVKAAELSILKEVHDFCIEHNIKYSLAYGTLLGAVRHGGFIPWDDDIDIFMERENYDKFISLWVENHPDGLILQNHHTDRDYTQGHTKIRKDNTTFLQQGESGNYHKGIFIDIFPMDRIPYGFRRKLFFFEGMLYMLYTRGFVPPLASGVVKLGSAFLLKVVPKNCYYKLSCFLEKRLTRFRNSDYEFVSIVEKDALFRVLKKDIFDECVMLDFEDSKFMSFKDYDYFLKKRYDDYMRLPPEEERHWAHTPLIIDFDRNCEELK